MRTLKRLEIGQLNVFEKLSAEEQGMIVGGYSSTPGNCFWNCMEYCSKKYDVKNERHNYKDFGNGYENGLGSWHGTGSNNQGVGYGPDFGSRNWDGSYTLEQEPYDYLASQFRTEGSEWTTGSNMRNYFGSGYDKDSVIIGTFDTRGKLVQGSENEAHAAIFTDYDPDSRTYTYHEANDPAKNPKTIGEDYVMGVAKVTGKK